MYCTKSGCMTTMMWFFICSFFVRLKVFHKLFSPWHDSCGPKIVKFQAILAIFWPFEDFWFILEYKYSAKHLMELPRRFQSTRESFGDRSGVVRVSFGGRSVVVQGRSEVVRGSLGDRSGIVRRSFGSQSGFTRKSSKIIGISFRFFFEILLCQEKSP